MTHYVREDTQADLDAEHVAKTDALWGNHPEAVINEAGGALWLLSEYMATTDADWLNKRLNDACERLDAKGDL